MPPDAVIRSRHNPSFKQIRSLLRRDRRYQERAFLVEGPRFIADAMTSGAKPLLLALAESSANASEMRAYGDAPVRVLSNELFAALSDTVTSQGVLAVFPFPEVKAPQDRLPFIVGADGIQDPGNLGTLIRSAAGAGVSQVVTLPGTADPWAPKTVRAAAGAQFLVPIASMSLDELAESIPDDALVLAADSAGEALYDECDLTGPLVVIVGSEGEGLSPSAMTLEPVLISIPLASGLESLNAGVAGSIVLFEASRQRRVRANLAKP